MRMPRTWIICLMAIQHPLGGCQTGTCAVCTIFRDVGANSPTTGQQNVFGWGLNLSTSLNVLEHDSVQAQLTYGQAFFTSATTTSPTPDSTVVMRLQ